MEDSKPFLAEFEEGVPTWEELQTYLGMGTPTLPSQGGRPYTWYNAVSSLDGVTSFVEEGDMGAAGVALAGDPSGLSAADARVLFAGRVWADALLHGGSTLRREPDAEGGIPLPDLAQAREEAMAMHPGVIKGTVGGPIQVILSGSGDLPASAHLWDPQCGLQVVVCTSSAGAQSVVQAVSGGVPDTPLPSHVSVVEFPPMDSERPFAISLEDVVSYLYSELGVHRLDVCAGGRAAAHMMALGLVDEIRITYTAQFVGRTNSKELPRSLLFDLLTSPPGTGPKHLSSSADAIGFEYVGIRAAGKRHIFLRAKLRQ